MPLNDLRIQIATAYPNLKKVDSGRGITLFGDIQTDQGVKKAFVKLLSVENIAKEALCAVVARKLHLPVQQPFYVSMVNTEYSGRSNIENIAFGSLNDRTPSFKLNSSQGIEEELHKWPDLLRSAVFDEWIANRDRIPNNMVFEKSGLFWLYDHDDAFPGYVGISTPANPQLLALKAKNKSEFELFKIRDMAMDIVNQYETLNWSEIYDLLRVGDAPEMEQFFIKYIDFLKSRAPKMRGILSQDLGIKQNELPFNQAAIKHKES